LVLRRFVDETRSGCLGVHPVFLVVVPATATAERRGQVRRSSRKPSIVTSARLSRNWASRLLHRLIHQACPAAFDAGARRQKSFGTGEPAFGLAIWRLRPQLSRNRAPSWPAMARSGPSGWARSRRGPGDARNARRRLIGDREHAVEIARSESIVSWRDEILERASHL
jgi:hypothetical protein